MIRLDRFAFTQSSEVEALARETEEQGWNGLFLSDSQNLQSDPYASLALAARATRRIQLGTAATNVETRLPAVTAAAIGTIDDISEGRAVLGLGRGDTALSKLGILPRPLDRFEQAVQELQGFLGGGLDWRQGKRKVPLHLFASGPRAMEIGARHAEQVTLAVAARPGRVREAIARLQPRPEIGLVVIVGLGRGAVDLVRGNVAIFARFVGESQVTDDFVREFAVVGDVEQAEQRLRELAEEGVSRMPIVGPWKTADATEHNALLPRLVAKFTS